MFQFLPTLQAQSTLSTTSVPSGVTPQTQWNMQAVINWTLWDGGVRYGNLRSQQAQRDQADASLEAQRRQAQIQVEQAKRNVTVTEDELRVAERTRSIATELDTRTQAGYRGGQLTSLDLVTAAAQRRQAEINDALAEFNAVSARIAAVFALATCRW
jgi:outer membrane protein TolC